MPVQLAKDLELVPSHGSPAAAAAGQLMSNHLLWQLPSRVPIQQERAGGWRDGGSRKLEPRCMLTHTRARVQRSSHS